MQGLSLIVFPKQEINETTKPKNETPNPNVVAEPLDVSISVMPKSDIEIPKKINALFLHKEIGIFVIFLSHTFYLFLTDFVEGLLIM